MGKWEPFLRAERCLEEVAARAAAALALGEALVPGGPGPYLLSAEAHLRGQPAAGCLIAAEILRGLGACPERLRCSPAANRTTVELHTLERMRRELGVERLLMVTAPYHAERVRALIARERLDGERLAVVSCEARAVELALLCLPPARRQRLVTAIARGHREGDALSAGGLNERLARLAARLPLLERVFADLVRGRVDPRAAVTYRP